MSELYSGLCTVELQVFVYGTLKPGGRYHQRYCGEFLTEAVEAIAQGQLYDFPQLGYPAMTCGNDWIKGYLLTFCQSATVCANILQRLDALEGYLESRSPEENDYQRYQQQIFSPSYEPLGQAWIYEMKRERVQDCGGVYLPSGKWSLSF